MPESHDIGSDPGEAHAAGSASPQNATMDCGSVGKLDAADQVPNGVDWRNSSWISVTSAAVAVVSAFTSVTALWVQEFHKPRDVVVTRQ